MNILSRYRQSLKNPKAEELLDLWLFRPMAFGLTMLLVRTRITPNQITGSALAASTVAGLCLAAGEPAWSIVGALLYALANVLDCSDGMVARLKHNGTELGRMVDVFADVAAGSAVYIGLGIGLIRSGADLPLPALVLVVLGGVSFAVQAGLFDAERNRFLSDLEPTSDPAAELEEIEQRASGSSSPRRLFVGRYLWYMRIQLRLWPARAIRPADAERTVRLWSFIGSTSHVTVFTVAILAGSPIALFIYTIVIANAWALLLVIRQLASNRRTVRATAGERMAAMLPRFQWIRR